LAVASEEFFFRDSYFVVLLRAEEVFVAAGQVAVPIFISGVRHRQRKRRNSCQLGI